MSQIADRIQSLDSKLLVVLSAVGLIVMAVAFVGYVSDPVDAYVHVFIIGVIVLAIGYGLINVSGKLAMSGLSRQLYRYEEDQFEYILDEDYVPEESDAEVVDLMED